jgi:hypothetical protein
MLHLHIDVTVQREYASEVPRRILESGFGISGLVIPFCRGAFISEKECSKLNGMGLKFR